MPESSFKKIIAAIMGLLVAIPVVLYLAIAILSLLILFFFIIPVVIPIATKAWYLGYVRMALREASRSPFYASLIATVFALGTVWLTGYLIGRKKIKTRFESVVEGDSVREIDGCLFVPFPLKMRVRESYTRDTYKHRGILIPAKPKYRWPVLRRPRSPSIAAYRAKTRKTSTYLKLLIALTAVAFSSMVAKDYLVLKGISTDMLSLANALGDLLLLWSALLLGVLVGKEILKRKISCSGLSSKVNVMGDYLFCSPIFRSGPYAVIYHLMDIDEISFDDAEKVYITFNAMFESKMDLSEWSKTET